MIVKGKTKSGLNFSVDERIKEDGRFLHYLAKAQKTEEVAEAAQAVEDLLALIFGGDDGVINFMNAVAAQHNGFCQVSVMIDELKEILDAINAKNSSSSHK